MTHWYLYILECNDHTLYTGITTDIERRVAEHQEQGPKSAKYLKGKSPLKLVYQEIHPDRSSASKREAAIKKLPRAKKLELIRTKA